MYPEWSHFGLLYQWLRKPAAVEVKRPHPRGIKCFSLWLLMFFPEKFITGTLTIRGIDLMSIRHLAMCIPLHIYMTQAKFLHRQKLPYIKTIPHNGNGCIPAVSICTRHWETGEHQVSGTPWRALARLSSWWQHVLEVLNMITACYFTGRMKTNTSSR